jgi:hypothetical protein
LNGLSAGLALRTAVSVRGIGGKHFNRSGITPECTPAYLRMSMDGIG